MIEVMPLSNLLKRALHDDAPLWAFIAEERGEMICRRLSDTMMMKLFPDVANPGLTDTWGAHVALRGQPMLPASIQDESDPSEYAGGTPTCTHAFTLLVGIAMVGANWKANAEEDGYRCHVIEPLPPAKGQRVSLVELPLQTWTFPFICKMLYTTFQP